MAFSKTLVLCLAVVHFLSMMNFSEAKVRYTRFHASWQIPPSPDFYEKWAPKKYRFHIGDFIVLNYDGKEDSVLEVNEADYKSCNRSNPINKHDDGNTEIALDKSGPFFFISGGDGHCEKGQKLQVRVLAANHHHHHHHSTAAPAPSPLPNDNKHHAPAPAPAHHNDGASLRVGVMVSAAAALIVFLV